MEVVANMNSIGDYIRQQREQAKISLRQLADQGGVSNPYLSQIERGLRKPSADILQQIAKGLRISAEALYVQAGILDDRLSDSGVRAALLSAGALQGGAALNEREGDPGGLRGRLVDGVHGRRGDRPRRTEGQAAADVRPPGRRLQLARLHVGDLAVRTWDGGDAFARALPNR